MTVCHVLGLDLGQVQDPSALCIVERTEDDTGAASYACRRMQRWPRGTTYPRIALDVLAACGLPALVDPVLAVDQTGVGRAVVDMLRDQVLCTFRPVTITAGHRWSRQPNGDYHVPKKDLVGCLQYLMGHGRLKAAASSPEMETLIKELENFRVKITAAANETFGAWREGANDDLVLALAIACWAGENAGSGRIEPPTADNRSEYSRAPEGVWISDGRGDDDGRG